MVPKADLQIRNQRSATQNNFSILLREKGQAHYTPRKVKAAVENISDWRASVSNLFTTCRVHLAVLKEESSKAKKNINDEA